MDSMDCSQPFLQYIGLARTFAIIADIRKLPVSNKTRTQGFQHPWKSTETVHGLSYANVCTHR